MNATENPDCDSGTVSFLMYKNETFSLFFLVSYYENMKLTKKLKNAMYLRNFEIAKCNYITVIYARDFGVLQNNENLGFIFMKLLIRCCQYNIGFAFQIFKN